MDDDKREIAERASWGQYRLLILAELERISKDIRSVNDKMEKFRLEDVAQMKTDITLLKFQAAMWGGLAGTIITVVLTLAIKFIRV